MSMTHQLCLNNKYFAEIMNHYLIKLKHIIKSDKRLIMRRKMKNAETYSRLIIDYQIQVMYYTCKVI